MREALSTTLATLPENFHAARSELLDMLLRRGILYQSPTQPILSRDGTSSRWMLNSLAVTLSPRGAELAGRCILKLLERFDGRQIATYGLTGVPILQSCVLQSEGRYRGLLVRKEQKEHGSLKLIEGEIDLREPVIVIDDSVSSGTCMEQAIERLEGAGLRVEGGICLVRFGWYGGFARMQERGYHMEAVYDIWDDFMRQMEGEELPLANPTKWFPEYSWSEHQAPEQLHPAKLARIVISEYLSSGKLLRPPAHLDRDYDSAGGAWVSVRSQSNIHQRHARDGFWHFPGEEHGSAAEDVVMASLRTAVELPRGAEGLALLDHSGIAVTFFGELEKCTPGQLDNDRYGIVVRSLERAGKMGGALPRMPGIRNEWEQFHHARIKNAQLISFEPYELFRHEVVKTVEPEKVWQPTGVAKASVVAWNEDQSVCGKLAERARDIVLAQLFGGPETTVEVSNDLLPRDAESLYLTIYIDGQLRGCMGSAIRNLDADLKMLADAALHDERFLSDSPNDPRSVAVSVSILFNALEIGMALPEEVGPYYRLGEQTLMIYRGEQLGLLLPFVSSMYNYDRRAFAEAVREKSGLTESPYYWSRFDCATWLADSEGAWPTAGGFPLSFLRVLRDFVVSSSSTLSPRRHREHGENEIFPEELLIDYAKLHARYLLKQLRPDGSLYSAYDPFQNRLYEGITLPHLAHAAWVFARSAKVFSAAAFASDVSRSGQSLDTDDGSRSESALGPELRNAADRVIEYLIGTVTTDGDEVWLEPGDETAAAARDETPSVAEVSFLMLALCELPASDPRKSLIKKLARPLWACIDDHGRIKTHRPTRTADAASEASDVSSGSAATASSDVSSSAAYGHFDAYQDYFPSQVLLALAAATEHAAAEQNGTGAVATAFNSRRTQDPDPPLNPQGTGAVATVRHGHGTGAVATARHGHGTGAVATAFNDRNLSTSRPSANVKAESLTLKDPSPNTNDQLQQAFRYYRHRFRYKRHFGQVSWLLLAFSKWWHVTHDSSFAEFVFEVADWLLEYQQEKTGAFINDHQTESPGYTTAVYLEGLAAALSVAASLAEIRNPQSAIRNSTPAASKDVCRYHKYRDSFIAGYGFLDRLIIQERDRSILPNLDYALRGLRQGTYYSHIRTDFVQHSLSALLEFKSVPAREGSEVAQATVAMPLQ